MPIRFDDVEDACEFVSSGPGEHTAYISKKTGQVFYRSDEFDEGDVPEDVDESDDYIVVPDKRDLDLAQALVFEFVAEHLPAEYAHVRGIFSRKGAHARFKDFLDSKGKLQDWYDYETAKTRAALRSWCEENNLELVD